MMAQWAECSLCKPENLSLDLRIHIRLDEVVRTCVHLNTVVGRWETEADTLQPAGLAHAVMTNKSYSISKQGRRQE